MRQMHLSKPGVQVFMPVAVFSIFVICEGNLFACKTRHIKFGTYSKVGSGFQALLFTHDQLQDVGRHPCLDESCVLHVFVAQSHV